MEGIPEQYLSVYFRNHEYYLDYSKSFLEGKKSQFNVAAFAVTGYWLVYRKMYLYAVLYFIGVMASQVLLSVALRLNNITRVDTIIAWEIVLAFISSIVFGFLGNRIYINNALKEVQKILQKYPQEADRTRKLQKMGGTSFWFVGLLILEILLLEVAN